MTQFRGGVNVIDPVEEGAVPSSGVFMRERVQLIAGRHVVRLQVQMSPYAQSETIAVRALSPEGHELAKDDICVSDADAIVKSDALTLDFHLIEPQEITFEGHVSANVSSTHLRFFTQAPVDEYEGNEDRFNFYPGDIPHRSLRFLVIGTTAVCNANCSHCPTNKAYSRTQAKGVMDMALFEKIIRELADLDFDGTVAFGLFGEPLQDPHLAARVEMIRSLCPKANISLSTNAALYDAAKHRDALEKISDIAVHIEALTSDVYETVMRPLKVRRTFPRAEQLIADQAGRVHIVSPVHRQNIDQVANIKSHWEERGAGETEFIALSNRCGQSPNYDSLALAPTAVGCGPEMVITELVVDWDGAVLTCCQDFHRYGRIGDLRRESVVETLASASRARVKRLFNEKRWNALKACAGCKLDSESVVKTVVAEKLAVLDDKRRFSADQFGLKGAARRVDGGILIDSRNLASAVGLRSRARRGATTGPNRRLTPGNYLVRFDLSDLKLDAGGGIALDVTDGSNVLTRHVPKRHGPWEMRLNVRPDEGKLEFRIHVRGARLWFSGVSIERIDLTADSGDGSGASLGDAQPVSP